MSDQRRRRTDHGIRRYQSTILFLVLCLAAYSVISSWQQANESSKRAKDIAALAKAQAAQAKSLALAVNRASVERQYRSSLAACERGNNVRRITNSNASGIERGARSIIAALQQVVDRSRVTVNDPTASPVARRASAEAIKTYQQIIDNQPRHQRRVAIVDCKTKILNPFPKGPSGGP